MLQTGSEAGSGDQQPGLTQNEVAQPVQMLKKFLTSFLLGPRRARVAMSLPLCLTNHKDSEERQHAANQSKLRHLISLLGFLFLAVIILSSTVRP